MTAFLCGFQYVCICTKHSGMASGHAVSGHSGRAVRDDHWSYSSSCYSKYYEFLVLLNGSTVFAE